MCDGIYFIQSVMSTGTVVKGSPYKMLDGFEAVTPSCADGSEMWLVYALEDGEFKFLYSTPNEPSEDFCDIGITSEYPEYAGLPVYKIPLYMFGKKQKHGKPQTWRLKGTT